MSRRIDHDRHIGATWPSPSMKDGRTMSTVRIGVLTSGGDAQGMNAAVRAVVRTALAKGAQPYAILEGWQGACDGGDSIKKMDWSDVSSISPRVDTVIGTARSAEFRTYEGRHRAAANLLEHGIDHLVVIGGDGSLSGTNEFRGEWSQHLAELVAEGAITQEFADAHPASSSSAWSVRSTTTWSAPT